MDVRLNVGEEGRSPVEGSQNLTREPDDGTGWSSVEETETKSVV